MTHHANLALSQIVLHEALSASLKNIDFLMSTKQPSEGCLVPLLGPTRVGKMSIVRHMLNNAGRGKGDLFPSEDVLYCSLAPRTSGKGIYGAILKAITKRVPPPQNMEAMESQLLRAIDGCGIKVLVLDEVNHLIERGANLAPREAADYLKTLLDKTGICIITIGLPRFQRIIDENEQLRDRACATTLLKPYDWQVASDRDAFTHTVDVALYKLEQAGLPVAIEFEDIVRRLYGASGGRIPVVMRLLKLCASTKQEPQTLTLSDFAIAAGAMQQSGIPISSFFSADEPDDVDILRSFACTMSEAGLEFSAGSIAGLDLAHREHSE